jgi:small subunit ribosomal protein S11
MATEQKNEVSTEKPAAKPKRKRKVRKNVVSGIIHIKSTFNNTTITLTDDRGEVIGWSSAGKLGFKGSRKSTPFAAQVVADDVMDLAQDSGMKRLAILVNGPGSGRETALRSIARRHVRVVHIQDVTPLPHNGCRPPKRRRV